MATTISNKKDILEALRDNSSQLKAFGVQKIGLFGSFIRGQQTQNSDIDLFVEFDPNQKTFDNFMALSFFLEDLLSHKVEIITPESLSPHIGPHILQEIEYFALKKIIL